MVTHNVRNFTNRFLASLILYHAEAELHGEKNAWLIGERKKVQGSSLSFKGTTHMTSCLQQGSAPQLFLTTFQISTYHLHQALRNEITHSITPSVQNISYLIYGTQLVFCEFALWNVLFQEYFAWE